MNSRNKILSVMLMIMLVMMSQASVFAEDDIQLENQLYDIIDDEMNVSDQLDAIENVSDLSDIRDDIILDEDTIIGETEGGTLRIEQDDPDNIEIESDESSDFTMKIDIDGDSDTVIEEDAIIHDTDNYCVATEMADGEVRNSFIIESENSPEEYSIDYSFEDYLKLEFACDDEGNTDGSVVAVDSYGNAQIAIDIPYAYDSNGKEIETYYQIEGNRLTQIVKHKEAAIRYPIVADPSTKFGTWFKSGKWIMNGSYRALELIPTATLRIKGGSVYLHPINAATSMSVINASWTALYNKYSGSKYWKNTGGMKDQYICHFYFAFYKSSFHLESGRRNVSLAKTIAAKCNP